MQQVLRALGAVIAVAALVDGAASAATPPAGGPSYGAAASRGVFCQGFPGPAGLGVTAVDVPCPEAAKVVNTWAARFNAPAVFSLDGTTWRCDRHPGTPDGPYVECVDTRHGDRKVDLQS